MSFFPSLLRLLLALMAFGSASGAKAGGLAPPCEHVSLSLVEGATRPISPMIYGLGHYTLEDKAWGRLDEIRPGAIRYGGNTSERFNFRISAWNTASDAGFANTGSSDPDFIGTFIRRTVKLKAAFAMTMPMLGWIAKDKSSRSPATGSNHVTTSEPLTADYIKDLTQKVTKEAGSQPVWFLVGNEPMLWSTTHKDIHPDPASYDEVLTKFLTTSRAIRAANSIAPIGGPALWGWLAMEQSAKDGIGEGLLKQTGVDRKAHGGTPFLEWFVSKAAGSLLNFVDVHHYSENQQTREREASQSQTQREARLRTTRSLWDKTYVDESWIHQPVQLIPRMKALRLANGTRAKAVIGEYNFRGEDDISGALAQLEAFAIFAEMGLDGAFYWTFPPPQSMVWKAWQLWRHPFADSDGMGDSWVKGSTGLGKELSAYGSRSQNGERLTMMILNKTNKSQQCVQIDLDRTAKLRRAMGLDSDGLHVPSQKITVDDRFVFVTMPSWGALFIEFEK